MIAAVSCHCPTFTLLSSQPMLSFLPLLQGDSAGSVMGRESLCLWQEQLLGRKSSQPTSVSIPTPPSLVAGPQAHHPQLCLPPREHTASFAPCHSFSSVASTWAHGLARGHLGGWAGDQPSDADPPAVSWAGASLSVPKGFWHWDR